MRPLVNLEHLDDFYFSTPYNCFPFSHCAIHLFLISNPNNRLTKQSANHSPPPLPILQPPNPRLRRRPHTSILLQRESTTIHRVLTRRQSFVRHGVHARETQRVRAFDRLAHHEHVALTRRRIRRIPDDHRQQRDPQTPYVARARRRAEFFLVDFHLLRRHVIPRAARERRLVSACRGEGRGEIDVSRSDRGELLLLLLLLLSLSLCYRIRRSCLE